MSPTGGIAELVQQMGKTILLWCSCLHLSHTECQALLGDAVLTRNTRQGMREKPKEGNEPGCLGGQAKNFKKPNTKSEVDWNQTTEDLIGKILWIRSDHTVFHQRMFPTGWLGQLLNTGRLSAVLHNDKSIQLIKKAYRRRTCPVFLVPKDHCKEMR